MMADICLHAENTEFGCDLLQPAILHIGDDDLHASREHSLCNALADARRAASHYAHFARKVGHTGHSHASPAFGLSGIDEAASMELVANTLSTNSCFVLSPEKPRASAPVARSGG